MSPPIEFELRRRTLLAGTAAAALALSIRPGMAQNTRSAVPVGAQTSGISVSVNGTTRQLTIDNRATLLDALREHLQLTGTKKGCDHGQCGACTVTLNGQRINSCLTLACMHDGDEVETIEGVGSADNLDPMQAAFVAHDGFQCGYCTPGQICSARAVLGEIRAGIPSHVTADLMNVTLSDTEIRERMSGNICRCGAYANILAAINEVAEERA